MTNAKILIVEDENIVSKYIQLSLKKLGYEVCATVSTGDDAIEKTKECKPDLVLMDILIKGDKDGIETASIIRENFNIPVIFMTAYNDDETFQRAKITEPFGYIVKPFEERELHINIEMALYKHKAEKKLKHSESLLLKTLENMGDGVITTNKNGIITFINPTAQKFTGFIKDDSHETHVSEVLKVLDQNKNISIDDITNQIINGDITFNYEDEVVLTNNKLTKIFTSSRITPLKDFDDNIIGAVFIFRDITEKKQSKEILRLIVDSTSSFIGDDFFKLLVKQLAESLNVSFAFICELKDSKEKIAKVISSWEMDNYGENIEFCMTNTPSENVISGNMVFYPEKIQHLFPKDLLLKNFALESYVGIPIFDLNNKVIGHLGVMHDKPIVENSMHQSILKFISQRASTELMRKHSEEAVKRSEEKYKQLTNSLPHTIFETDSDYRFNFINTHASTTFAYSAEEILGNLSLFDIVVPEERDKLKEGIQIIMSGNEPSFTEYNAIKKDLTSFPVLIYLNPIFDSNSSISGVRGIIIDISEIRKTEKALKESEERYSLTLTGMNDGFWDWNTDTDEMYFSPRWKYMLGYDENEITNSPNEWFSRVHHEDIKVLKEKIRFFKINQYPSFEQEYRILNRDGKYTWVVCRGRAVKDSKGNTYRIFGSQTDINKRKTNEQMLERLLHNVSHDALTSLPNRSLFLERLEKSIIHSKRKKDYKFAVLFIDIDRFKIINDSLGHATGNLLLIETAIRLQLCVRPEDTVARLGSDEFTVMLEDIYNETEALRISKKIQKDLSTPFILNGHEVFASASTGIAMSSSSYESPEEILRDADIAMRKAKNLGRARHELFDADMHTHALELLQIETDMRYAIERNEFVLHYQPIVSLKTGRITGFEALIRWKHPKKGMIGSDVFIPIAEETGMIIPIGRWVFEEACRQIKLWHEMFNNKDLTMSINISGKQFSHPKLINNITQTLEEVGVEPSKLKLEITESTIMENAETARNMLEQIRSLKIQLQIDDFGTGYSSLSYLHRFPVNTLKVDRSFVSRIGSNDENVEIVKTIVSLAKNLNMVAIAEGIETEAQLNKLKSLNCEYGQGYFFSRPVGKEVIEDLLSSNPVW